jgi:hypothetical protein
MAFDYATLRDGTVEALIDDFGDDGTLYVNDPGSGNEWDSQIESEVPHAVRLVRTQFTRADNNGTLVEETDSMFLISTAGVTVDPELAHRLEVNGTKFQVVRVDPLKPGPVTMLWRVHARK